MILKQNILSLKYIEEQINDYQGLRDGIEILQRKYIELNALITDMRYCLTLIHESYDLTKYNIKEFNNELERIKGEENENF